ncbi:hypothetical protein QIH87_14180 [Bradyrhizobium elkanii]|uniref:hypothetical protein n=1 Tax=Bradyrhizobium elkanii TaxID=29448 RepID=UPI00101F719E|nr:hypothetical protein [Bradyrhizobium elkanii]MCW2112494.1 ABC-type phosphate transport system auxiliary subunit [Bradyrhizobium elkanii]MCW2199149.1 ABC-type phosphate transport system auxiliary subunit [Bradyrhizobium elkanii]MCW2229298.1 ABC-type phosphate transport system auxiliary subunit [Bradyrhizobium elkanii]NWL38095.1 hypothetical protein [Bradyrhizobium elkanii]RYM15740.1 hypothetical protein EWH13_38530 [Bradyrhizobium elkanii]
MASEKSDKLSRNKKMVGRAATLDEAADLLRQIAGTRHADESIKGVLHRLQRKLTGWSAGRIRDVWYRDERVRLRAEEVEQLRALAEPAHATGTENELSELRNRIARLERLLEAASAPVHR